MQAYIRAGRVFRPWDNRPRILDRLVWVWGAFWELGTCRQMSTTIGPIPWTAIERWAEANDVLVRERFIHLVRRLDDAFLSQHLKSDEGG